MRGCPGRFADTAFAAFTPRRDWVSVRLARRQMGG